MKKNISINISGIIFHIEEDGYDVLRKYLDSINSYFGTFEDSSEILADIESRIAEIFLSRLNDGKQIITAEDVASLTATMGSVNDFKAAEEPAEEVPPTTGRQANAEHKQSATRKLVRDQKRKILGGVCAGLANYFSIDPVWPRLLFALLVLGTYGIFIPIYIVLWIIMPLSNNLEEEPTLKKMYRDPDHKVIGGVAGGVAAFFGTDVVLIRILFVIGVFIFGTGLLVYIILWIVLPEAKTITDKMKMQGEPLTLSNIESSVKKSLDEKDGAEESTLTKIILFPFRLIATIVNGVARLLIPLLKVVVDIFRVAIGLVFTFSGFIMILSLLFLFCVLIGLFNFSTLELGEMHIRTGNLPLEAIRLAFPTWTLIFAFLAAIVPALVIAMIGSSIIAKRSVFRGMAGWSLLIVFFISIAFLAFRIPQLVYSFKEEGEYKEEKIFAAAKTPVLKIREIGLDDYNFTELSIKGYSGTDIKLIERFGAQGISRLVAKENAKQIEYNVTQTDSVLTFDSNLTFKPNARFSFQRLKMDLYIPYDKAFVMDEGLWKLISNHWRHDSDSWRYDYNEAHEDEQTFKINQQGKMECVSCPPPTKEMLGLLPEDQFGLKDFTEIKMSGLYDVVIREGNEFAITMEGSPRQRKLYELSVDDETLVINYHVANSTFWKQPFMDDDLVKLTIVMPSLNKLNVTGAGKIKLTGFNEDEAKITMTGAMVVDARVSVNQLYLELSGPIVFELDGDGDFMEATISKTAQLKASSYRVNHGIIEAKELGQARVNVTESLEIDKDFTSTVRYQGQPASLKIIN